MPGPALAVGAFIGGMFSAFGKLKEGDAEWKAAQYQAETATEDAFVADRNAELVMDRAKNDYKNFRVMARRELGSMKTQQSASGLIGGEDLLQEAAAVYEHDAQNILINGINDAGAYNAEARRKRRTAENLRQGGIRARDAGQIGAVGSLITGAADAATKMPSSASRSATLPVSDTSSYSYGRYQRLQRTS